MAEQSKFYLKGLIKLLEKNLDKVRQKSIASEHLTDEQLNNIICRANIGVDITNNTPTNLTYVDQHMLITAADWTTVDGVLDLLITNKNNGKKKYYSEREEDGKEISSPLSNRSSNRNSTSSSSRWA